MAIHEYCAWYPPLIKFRIIRNKYLMRRINFTNSLDRPLELFFVTVITVKKAAARVLLFRPSDR